MEKFEFILSLIAFIITCATLVGLNIVIFKNKKGEVSDEELEKAKKIVITILERVGLALFTDAEITYGGGTGVLKMSSVLFKIVELLPDNIKGIVPLDWLTEQAEHYLEEAKKKWLANEKLLKK